MSVVSISTLKNDFQTGDIPTQQNFYDLIDTLSSSIGNNLGTQGPQGSQGNDGAQGQAGATGQQGPQGVSGQQGAQGATGQGTQGQEGSQGPQGFQGAQGSDGQDGPQGSQGVAGTQGIDGRDGTQGPQGSQGLGFVIAKIYTSLAELQADTEPTGIIAGEFAIINSTDADNSKLYLWSGSTYLYVTDLSGAQGVQGPTGQIGPQGQAGNNGAQGTQGQQGSSGATGAQGSQGPQGLTGQQGSQGAAGASGSNGTQGATGTQGPQGSQGSNGVDGQQGPQGQIGANGILGLPSQVGHDNEVLATDGTNLFWQTAGIFSYVGSWNSATVYYENQVVSFNGSSWCAKQTNQNSVPATDADWYLIAAQGAQGVTGATGVQGPQGFNGINLVPKGAWNSATSYNASDCVTYGGSAWQCTASNTNQTPQAGSYWSLFVGVGPQGTAGTNGTNGAQGSQGSQGQQGSAGIGNVQVRGPYTGSTSYNPNDIATYQGKAWLCTLATTSIPTVGPNWQIFVDQGNVGTQGPQGTQGYKGDQGNQGYQGWTGPQGTQGTQGVQGATGIADAVYKGAWNSLSIYNYHDCITYNGSAYICLLANSNTNPSNATYWQLFISQGAQGVQGTQGTQGVQGFNGTNLVYHGVWNNSTAYVVDDCVTYNGSAYFCTNPNTNDAPTDSANWQIFVSQGVQGPQGTQGYTGATIQWYAGTVEPDPSSLPVGTLFLNTATGLVSNIQYLRNAEYQYVNMWVGISNIIGPQGYQGNQGNQGNQGYQGLQGFAGINAVPKGAWNSATGYITGDLISYNGSAWIASQASTNQTPSGVSSYWTLFTSVGSQGPQGFQGIAVTGPQGVQGLQGVAGIDGIVVRGAWVNTTVYSQRDVVYSAGSAWYCLEANSGVLPQNNIYWTELVSQGAQGNNGINLVPRGAWNSLSTYAQGDCTTYGGSAWQALTVSTNQIPAEGNYWTQFSAQGNTGAQGPQGSQGSTGATGAQGSQGQGFIVAKTYASVAALTADVSPTGIATGQFAIINTNDVNNPEDAKLYLWNGTTYTFIVDLSGTAGVQGAQGPQGSTGTTGAQGQQGNQGNQGTPGNGNQGSQGPQGFQGFQGNQGNQGFQGSVNTLAIGTVLVGTAAATITGSSPNQTLNLTLPQGPQGAQGATGTTGSQGPQGSTGVTGTQGAQGAQGTTGSSTLSGTATGAVDFANYTINRYCDLVYAGGTTGASVSIALVNGLFQKFTLGATTAFTMPSVQSGASFTMLLVGGASFVPTFSGVNYWMNTASHTTAPTLAVASGNISVLTFFCDGTSWYGQLSSTAL